MKKEAGFEKEIEMLEKAELTAEEAEAFFPLFFELQKKKWLINKETREKLGIKCGEECSEEKSILMANELAETKIKIIPASVITCNTGKKDIARMASRRTFPKRSY